MHDAREFWQYRFDLRAGTLNRKDRVIELNPKCAATLAYLVERAGSVVTKDELLAAVWPEGSVEPNNVPQTIYVLRRTFKLAGDDDELIATIPGRGYRFVPPVHIARNGAIRSSLAAPWWRLGGIAALVTAMIVGVTTIVLHSPKQATPQISDDARVAYMQGRFYWSRRTPDNVKIALKLFESAISIEPRYAQAYSGLADTYAVMMWSASTTSDARRFGALARKAAEHSVALDPSCAECHTSLALISENGHNRKNVEREFLTAIKLDPNYATAHEWYGWALFYWSEKKQGLAEMNRAAELDPTSPIIKLALGWQQFYNRQFDRALSAFIDASTLDPKNDYAFFGIALSDEQTGHQDDAIKAIDQAVRLNPDLSYSVERSRLLAEVHRRQDAEKSVARLLAERPKPLYYLALLYDALDRRQLAERYYALAKQRHDAALNVVLYDPRADALSSSGSTAN